MERGNQDFIDQQKNQQQVRRECVRVRVCVRCAWLGGDVYWFRSCQVCVDTTVYRNSLLANLYMFPIVCVRVHTCVRACVCT